MCGWIISMDSSVGLLIVLIMFIECMVNVRAV